MDAFDFARHVKKVTGIQLMSITFIGDYTDISLFNFSSANEAERALSQIFKETPIHDSGEHAHWCSLKKDGINISAFYK